MTQVSQYQKKHSLTHTLLDMTTSLINFLHLLWSTSSSLHSCWVSQSFYIISLQVYFDLSLGLTHSTSKSMHFFTQSFSSFLKICQYHVAVHPPRPIIILISARWSVKKTGLTPWPVKKESYLLSFSTGHNSLPCNVQLYTHVTCAWFPHKKGDILETWDIARHRQQDMRRVKTDWDETETLVSVWDWDIATVHFDQEKITATRRTTVYSKQVNRK